MSFGESLDRRWRRVMPATRDWRSDPLFFRRAAAFLVVYALGTGASFLLHVLLARLLGVGSYGCYVYAATWGAVLLLTCRVGLDTSALRFTAAYRAEMRWGLLRGFLRWSTTGVFLASVATALLTAAGIEIIRRRLSPELALTLLVVCLLLPFDALLQLIAAHLRALKRVLTAQVFTILLRPALLAAGVLALFRRPAGAFGAPAAMSLNTAATALCLGGAVAILVRTLPQQVRSSRGEYRGADWRQTAAPLFLMAGLQVALNRADVIMLGSLASTTEAGIYAAANRIAALTLLGLTAVNYWIAPVISELHAKGNRTELQRLVLRATRGIAGITVPVAVAVIALGPALLGYFGTQFSAGYVALVVLTGGQFVVALTGPVGFLLTMTGHQGEAAWVEGGSAAANVALNAALIPPYGMAGAAVATALALSGRNLSMAWLAHRRLGIRVTVF